MSSQKAVRSFHVGAEDRLRAKEAVQEAHTSVGTIYVWLKEERFKSWTVRRKGFDRGIRYIDAKSFRNWLKLQREEVSH